MSAVESLKAWGVVRSAEVVELAAAAGLELACAATMLEKESGGGYNVWGHDAGSTGGAYVKGAEVTAAAYRHYRALQDAGKIGAQGVGPCQLTWPPLQRQADAKGGCWDWRANCTVGFAHLADLQRAHGVRGGFRRYNGSGPAAEAYADDAMAKLARWRLRLGGPDATTTEDDMTPEQARMLTEVHAALTTRWQTWQGGTDEQLTLTDLARRANVEVRQVHPSLTALHAKVDQVNAKLDALLARPAATPVDPDEVRHAVTEALADGLTLSVAVNHQ